MHPGGNAKSRAERDRHVQVVESQAKKPNEESSRREEENCQESRRATKLSAALDRIPVFPVTTERLWKGCVDGVGGVVRVMCHVPLTVFRECPTCCSINNTITRCRHTFGTRDMFAYHVTASVTCTHVIRTFARGPVVEGTPLRKEEFDTRHRRTV